MTTWQGDLGKLENSIIESSLWNCPVCGELNLPEEQTCFNCSTRRDSNYSDDQSDKVDFNEISLLLNNNLASVQEVKVSNKRVNSLLNKLIKKENNEIFRLETNKTRMDDVNKGINKFIFYFHYISFAILGISVILLLYSFYSLMAFDTFAWSHQDLFTILYGYVVNRISRIFGGLGGFLGLFFNSARYLKIISNIQALFANIFNKFPTA